MSAKLFRKLKTAFALALVPIGAARALAADSPAQCVARELKAVRAGVSPEELLREARARELAHIENLKTHVKYPEIPSVDSMSMAATPPYPGWYKPQEMSVIARDAKAQSAYEEKGVIQDFKPFSDLVPTERAPEEIEKEAQARFGSISDPEERRKKALAYYLENRYRPAKELFPVARYAQPEYRLASRDPGANATFAYIQKDWANIVRQPVPSRGGSLLSLPYPALTPAGRFTEAYNWDSYFTLMGLLATGDQEALFQTAENFLTLIRHYGFVPNGTREYYLTRSQPPFASSIVTLAYRTQLRLAKTPAEKTALARELRERIYPLLKHEYQDYWMAPDSIDPASGLNRFKDAADTPRPERHSHDNELEIGKTYNDTRAAAATGLDFTDVHQREASRIANPLLNGMLFKTEKDLAFLARQLGETTEAERFEAAARTRKAAMDRYLWNPKEGRYENYNTRTGKRVDVLTAETVVPLFVGAASPEQAAQVAKAIQPLRSRGGLTMNPLFASPHQWDGNNVWAPFQYMAVYGLKNYGYTKSAEEIARSFVTSAIKTYEKRGFLVERFDGPLQDVPPVDEKKYPPQPGFGWTNGVVADFMVNVLHYPIEKITPPASRAVAAPLPATAR